MARVTNEDALPFVEGNHFKLVNAAAELAKAKGLTPMMALKEIEEGRYRPKEESSAATIDNQKEDA